ncbi:hypothetical protein EMPS_06267 [Entomortierella parvispora]|uniref:Uncharacterized protein n=1 Tax=Entomortierella parvispora TaxID=205924 RepID=A0A9P3HBY9_9FUNG|nr:hypothetical protein EMPS_06267 [Entomortierella parvispora]
MTIPTSPLSINKEKNHTVQFPNHPIPRAIFLDSGGVINCNDTRGPQWIQYLTEYMPTTVLQGPGLLWGRANKKMSHDLFVDKGFDRLMAQAKDHEELDRLYRLHWIQRSVDLVNQYIEEAEEKANEHAKEGQDATSGVTPVHKKIVLPESEEEQIAIAKAAHDHCVGRVRADYPGAVEAILALKQKLHFELFTCSGESSTDLKLTFRTLGIRAISDLTLEAEEEEDLHPIFTKLYGPDLINCHKASTRFYELIFEDCGVPAHEALVVDDKESILAWAKVLGAITVQISTKDRTGNELMVDQVQYIQNDKTGALEKKTVQVPAVDYQLGSLAELPALVAQWKNRR